MFNSGDVVIAYIQFTDTFEIKAYRLQGRTASEAAVKKKIMTLDKAKKEELYNSISESNFTQQSRKIH